VLVGFADAEIEVEACVMVKLVVACELA